MVVEFILRGLKTKTDTDVFISLLKAGSNIENEYIIEIIQELVAKCKALEPLNHGMLDMLKISDKQAKEIERLKAELKQLKEEHEKAKSNTHGIDWKLFATGEIAVQCETEEDAEEFLKEAIKRGYRCFHRKLTGNDCKSETCFSNEYTYPIGTFIVYGNKSYYEDKGIKVVKWKPDVKESINKLIKYCRDLRKENESLKNDKTELLIAIENAGNDLGKTTDYLSAVINGFTGDKA